MEVHDVCGRQRQPDLVRRNVFRQAMNRVEFGDGLPVGIVVAFRRERPLADVDDHEGDIHVALDHLRQINLRRQTHRVIAFRRELARLDVVVRVDLDHAIVNPFRFCDQCGFRGWGAGRLRRDLKRNREKHRCAGDQTRER